MNANLSLHFLPLDTTPHTVVPTTGHGRDLEQSRGRTGELIFQVNVIETWFFMLVEFFFLLLGNKNPLLSPFS